MGKIREKYYKYFIIIVTGIISGFLVCAVSLGMLVSYRFDCYHQQIAELESIISEDKEKLNKLEDSIKSRKYVLKDIEIVLDFSGHDLEKIAIEKAIKEKYKSLLGKDIKSIDIEITAEVIDKRVLKFNDKEYRLKLEKLMLTEVLKLWVKAETVK